MKDEEQSMSEAQGIPLLNHELAADELAWMKSVHEDFSKLRAACAEGRGAEG